MSNQEMDIEAPCDQDEWNALLEWRAMRQHNRHTALAHSPSSSCPWFRFKWERLTARRAMFSEYASLRLSFATIVACASCPELPRLTSLLGCRRRHSLLVAASHTNIAVCLYSAPRFACDTGQSLNSLRFDRVDRLTVCSHRDTGSSVRSPCRPFITRFCLARRWVNVRLVLLWYPS